MKVKVETREWTWMDRSTWMTGGPWDDEPDKKQWEDPETKLPCLIHRGPTGALCGYVGVPIESHLAGRDYNDLGVRVHGGLTFANKCAPHSDNPEHGICHVVPDDEEVFWFGFDCNHSGDSDLLDSGWGDPANYKCLRYVEYETTQLAKQIKEILDA